MATLGLLARSVVAWPPKPALSAELWTRLRLLDGVELSFDSTKHQPDVQALLALRDAVRDVFQRREEE